MSIQKGICTLAAVLAGLVFVPSSGFAQPMSEAEMEREMAFIEEEIDRQFEDGLEEFIMEKLPEFAARMEEMEEEIDDKSISPRAKLDLYREALNMFDVAQHYRILLERFPDSAKTLHSQMELELEAQKLADRYHDTASEEEKSKIEKSIRTVLADSFEISQTLREQEAVEIEKELEYIRANLQERRKNRELIIGRRLHELLYGEDPFEW